MHYKYSSQSLLIMQYYKTHIKKAAKHRAIKEKKQSRMATICKGKDSWPELLGKQGKFAEETIEEENPNVNAEIVLEGTEVREDFRCNRVWVWVDTNGIVTRVPVIG